MSFHTNTWNEIHHFSCKGNCIAYLKLKIWIFILSKFRTSNYASDQINLYSRGGYFTKVLVGGDPNQIWGFVKLSSQKRSKNNKRGQQDRKSRRHLVQNNSKLSNDRFGWKIRPDLGQIIFGTIWDIVNPMFVAEWGGHGIVLNYSMKTQHGQKMSQMVVNHGEVPYQRQVWWCSPPPRAFTTKGNVLFI